VGQNKQLRMRLEGLGRQIREHQTKIGKELARDAPDEGRIAAWQREIEVWKRQTERLSRRLRGR